MKKILYIVIYFLFCLQNMVFAVGIEETIPRSTWLPWDWIRVSSVANDLWWKFVSILIKYIAVIAVISLMIAWIMYLLSWWEEEKAKKAKNWVIWSLVWVFLSVFAWTIVNFINQLYISN